MKRTISIFIATLVVAIVAMGSVSATENVTADVTVPTEEISVDDVVENQNVESEDTDDYDIHTTDDANTINSIISNSSGGNLYFQPGTYNNMNLTLKSGVHLYGNGATLVGTGSSPVFNVFNVNNITIANFIINVNSTSKAGIYGSFVDNANVLNNTIYNGKDGVSFFKSYENVTITDNTIYQVSRDAISLANPLKSDIDNIGESYIMNNVIYSGSSTTMEFGIFVGGTFKGTISGNNITNVDCAMQFAGKPTGTQGHLNVNIINNIISNVSRGIDMFHPDVITLFVYGNSITATNYSFNTNENFTNSSEDSISVIGNVINGVVSQAFIDATHIASDNTGTNAYNKTSE